MHAFVARLQAALASNPTWVHFKSRLRAREEKGCKRVAQILGRKEIEHEIASVDHGVF